MLEKVFRITKHNSTVRTEIIAGITTFMTMAYILAVNPAILSDSGMEFGKVFAATAIASAIASFVMGFTANLPFALSAGMGLNAVFSYTVCIGMGYSYQWALSAVFCEGLVFIILTVTNIREAIVTSIPDNLKKAIGSGVGLFIAYIGLKNSGIIIADPSNLTALNPEWYKGAPVVAIIGIIITGFLLAINVRGALLIGMLITTLIGIPFGVTTYAGGSFTPPAPYFCEFAFAEIFSNQKTLLDFITVVFTFLYFDMFDTVGTLIACAGKSNIIREDGSIPNAKKALLADAIGTTVGSILGTSTVTTFVESSAGVAEGGRTGLTAVVTGIMFVISLFLAPLFGSIPSAATAPALIIVGVMMISPIKSIDFDDLTEAIPAFITIIFMICASSISDGIMFGVLFYVIIKMLSGKFRELHFTTYIVAALFILKLVVDVIA
ncbi:NCS2 family permease [Butyrivibrio sp. LC3010]|uniref:NCS2 family permease n=1 Tax=Butyrivibrio sp. LC3010 TaxID=1280680 RepID=UPI00041446EA|nr:NCS2 family permease [Butyrivibrio sp. LC3010]